MKKYISTFCILSLTILPLKETTIPYIKINNTLNEKLHTINQNTFIINGERGIKSIKNLIKTAFEPLGKVMYIYGGGWNEQDNGASIEAMSLGVSQNWIDFSKKQTASYDERNYNYKQDKKIIHDGLDCSAYIGWIIYNVINDGQDYVTYSYEIDDLLHQLGYGTIYTKNTFTDYKPGDIMTSHCCKHIYLCLGQCTDGSILLLHSSPPGVQLTGTYTPQGNTHSEAIKLANQYMSTYYPEWHQKYPDSSRNESFITHYDKFEWSILSDEEGFRNMSPDEVLKAIFEE